MGIEELRDVLSEKSASLEAELAKANAELDGMN